MTKEQMLIEIEAYLVKVEAMLGSGTGTHVKLTLAANATGTVNIGTLFPPANFEIFSAGIDVKVQMGANVIPAYNYVDWLLSPAGVVTITNNYTGSLDVYVTVQPPIRK